jgi:hypothetical protein
MRARLLFIVVLSSLSFFPTIFAQGDSLKTKPYPVSQWGLSCFYGISAARVEGDGLLEKYFTPTSTRRLVIGQPFGLEVQNIFLNHFGISMGLRYHHLGQNTGKTRVMFVDDIFPHDFQTSAEYSYLSMPIILKGGLVKERYWAFVCIGGVGQVTLQDNVSWKIDGRDATPGSSRMPEITSKWTTTSYILGFETGIKIHNNGFYLMGNGLYGRSSFASGLDGTAIHQSVELCLGYRRFF